MEKTEKKTSKKKLQEMPILDKQPQQMTLVELVEQITVYSKNQNFSAKSITLAEPYLQEFATRFELTVSQGQVLVAMLHHYDRSEIGTKDLTKFFNCSGVRILALGKDIAALVKKNYLRKRKKYDGTTYYVVPEPVLDAVRENRSPQAKHYDQMSALEFVDTISDLLEQCENDRLNTALFEEELYALCEANQQLNIAQAFLKIKLHYNDLIIFAGTIHRYVQHNDECVRGDDLEEYLDSRHDMRHLAHALESGEHPLMEDGWLEHAFSDGQIDPTAWHLTNKAKQQFLSELNLKRTNQMFAKIMKSDKLTEKHLYFNEKTGNQVNQLRELLQPDKFIEIQARLKQKGMRTGFACIFYGSPGTGKTETVYQLARQTGRGIMMVDIPNMRSKWVGDTEKNIKQVFDNYRLCCEQNTLAPILLFNEADAILCKRQEGATTGVDKMENAMQNIILQEMETLDGIMIATTNLTGNLDAAFERRFLYKVEFEKPTPKESRHIWLSLMPHLTNSEALVLAEKYSFSGGQIENIARKQEVDAILTGNERPTLTTLIALCEQENLNSKRNRVVGFN